MLSERVNWTGCIVGRCLTVGQITRGRYFSGNGPVEQLTRRKARSVRPLGDDRDKGRLAAPPDREGICIARASTRATMNRRQTAEPLCQARPPLHRQPDAATMIVCALHVTSVTLKEPLAGVGPRSALATRRSRHRIRGQDGRDTGPDHGGDPRRTCSFPDGTACMRGDISDG